MMKQFSNAYNGFTMATLFESKISLKVKLSEGIRFQELSDFDQYLLANFAIRENMIHTLLHYIQAEKLNLFAEDCRTKGIW